MDLHAPEITQYFQERGITLLPQDFARVAKGLEELGWGAQSLVFSSMGQAFDAIPMGVIKRTGEQSDDFVQVGDAEWQQDVDMVLKGLGL